MSELSEKWEFAWKYLCKRMYGHEDLSKAYIYAPYIPLLTTPPIISSEPTVRMQRKQTEGDTLLPNEVG